MWFNNGHAEGGSDGGVDGVPALLKNFVADGGASIVIGHHLVSVLNDVRGFCKYQELLRRSSLTCNTLQS